MDHPAPVLSAELLPAELAQHTVESLYALHGPDRAWLYWMILGGMVVALAALPLVKVDVSVRAPGEVRPAADRVELRTGVTARVREAFVSDNDRVERGQVLLTLVATEIEEQISRQEVLHRERSAAVSDLARLLKSGEEAEGLTTAALRQERVQYRSQLDAYRLAEAKAGGELERYARLADKGIATRQELDNARFEADRVAAEARLFREQTRTRWAAWARDEQTALADLASSIRRLEEERARYVLRSPADGVLVGFTGLIPGSQVLAGESLGAVSPADAVRIESHVSSRDIGLVRVGQKVRIQVDAYPYTQWGMLDGTVEAISGDLWRHPSGGPGFFKVLVRPAAGHVTLPNGLRGELRKGLTLTVRYVVARRSLLQILYEDVSAWMSPQGPLTQAVAGPP